MMMIIPSAPGTGAGAADPTLPGGAAGAAPNTATQADGMGLALPFARLLDLAALVTSTEAANAELDESAAESAPDAAGGDTAGLSDTEADKPADTSLAAMLPLLNLAVPPTVQPPTAAALPQATPTPQPAASADKTAAIAATSPAAGNSHGADAATLRLRPATQPAALADQARQAAADAITAGTQAAIPPATRAAQAAALPAAADTLAVQPTTPRSQPAGTVNANPATTTATTAVATVTAAAVTAAGAGESAAQGGQEGEAGSQDSQAGSFRTMLAAASADTGSTAADAVVKLTGSAEQWQQPLRAALGDRLQLQLQKNGEQAVIRLDPPNLGSIEISIRHSAGALQVNLSATNSDVLRQLNAIGDSMRQDLSQRQYGDVAVTVSASSAQRSLADSEGRGRQSEREQQYQQQRREPGRALSDGDDVSSTFAMLRE